MGPWKSIAEIKRASLAIGNYWWKPDVMEYWHARIESEVLYGRYLIASHQWLDENYPQFNGPVFYTLWFVDDQGRMVADIDYCNKLSLQECQDGAAIREGDVCTE
jgi:hypothetical protein